MVNRITEEPTIHEIANHLKNSEIRHKDSSYISESEIIDNLSFSHFRDGMDSLFLYYQSNEENLPKLVLDGVVTVTIDSLMLIYPDLFISSPPSEPTKISKDTQYIIIGLVTSLFAAFIFTLAIDIGTDKLHQEKDIVFLGGNVLALSLPTKNRHHVFSERLKGQATLSKLLDAANNKAFLSEVSRLENDISVFHDTSVVAITSIDGDFISATFAKALANSYAQNGLRALIVDANFYNPSLTDIFPQIPFKASSSSVFHEKYDVNNNLSVITCSSCVYPSRVYKSSEVHNLIANNASVFDRIILLIPSIITHGEVSLLSGTLSTVLCLVKKDVTKKSEVFDVLKVLNDSNQITLVFVVLD